jgi:membrane associated rhomboid family serine protease
LGDGVKILLIWNGIFFLLQQLLMNGLGTLHWEPFVRVRLHGFIQTLPYEIGSLEKLLGLVPVLVWQKFLLWQPITYMFLHGGLWHILFNMFALWMFGGEIERLWGTARFLKYYFFTGIGAGLLSVVLQPFSPTPTIGASGAVYGLLLAYAYYFPHRKIFIYFLFPVPARVFVLIIGLIAFLNSWNAASGIANIAHLGGLIFGWIYIKGGSLMRRRRRGDGGSRRVTDFRTEDPDWWRP